MEYFVEKDGKKVATSEGSLIIPAGHKYGEWNEEVPATCKKTGTKGYQKCSVCGKNYDADGVEIESLVIAKKEHTYGEPIPATESTCTTQGMVKHCICATCGTYFRIKSDGSYEATSENSLKRKLADHSYGAWNAEVPATCTTDGTKGYQHCSVCGKNYDANGVEIEDLTIPAGHNMVTKWDETSHWSECTANCGEKTDPEAHRGGTATETEKAKCEVCGQEYGENAA